MIVCNNIHNYLIKNAYSCSVNSSLEQNSHKHPSCLSSKPWNSISICDTHVNDIKYILNQLLCYNYPILAVHIYCNSDHWTVCFLFRSYASYTDFILVTPASLRCVWVLISILVLELIDTHVQSTYCILQQPYIGEYVVFLEWPSWYVILEQQVWRLRKQLKCLAWDRVCPCILPMRFILAVQIYCSIYNTLFLDVITSIHKKRFVLIGSHLNDHQKRSAYIDCKTYF